MTDDLTALVLAVAHAPADAAPRGALADLLDELGHAAWAADLRGDRYGRQAAAFMRLVFQLRSRVAVREVLSAVDAARAVVMADTYRRDQEARGVRFR